GCSRGSVALPPRPIHRRCDHRVLCQETPSANTFLEIKREDNVEYFVCGTQAIFNGHVYLAIQCCRSISRRLGIERVKFCICCLPTAFHSHVFQVDSRFPLQQSALNDRSQPHSVNLAVRFKNEIVNTCTKCWTH